MFKDIFFFFLGMFKNIFDEYIAVLQVALLVEASA
jgi:hypothetical protein